MERFDLGDHTRIITTKSDDAQRLFNLGLNWCFGFNQEEGVACFQRVLEFDPDCAMAHWGIAYAGGPFYNLPWCDLGDDEAVKMTRFCYDRARMAKKLSAGCTTPEKALIDTLLHRFQKPHPVTQLEHNQWDDDYADAMRGAYQAYPDDFDVAALFIEAIMTRTPWQLWNVKTGVPTEGANTVEALEACERMIKLADDLDIPQHPAILHLHIHVTEMSNTPERSMRAADLMSTACPDAGHMNHMPGHTYVLCGEYEKAKVASELAIRADDMYVDYAGPYNFYTTARCHDLHLMMYTCMFLGQYKPAIDAASKTCETLTKDVLSMTGQPQMAVTMEGYYAMKMHVLIRFGRWQDIVDTPMPDDPELYCVSTAMHHYAKGVAHAALKNFDQAEEQRRLFHAACTCIPENRRFFNNTALASLGIGEKMLDGELEYHKGNYAIAFEHLRESVRRDDNLEYSEPWAWMHPPRHALAALLMEQGHYTEAEAVYRADLGLNDTLQRCAQHPRNVWALHGFVECLRKRGDIDELPEYEALLAEALTKTDVPITSSCMCRTNVTPCCDK
jgi:tetratricopeptide (TPR) repeat protein